MRQLLSMIVNELLFYLLFFRMRLRKSREGAGTGVLFIRFSHIGDFVLWLDAAKELRKIFAGEKITLLCDRFKDIRPLAEKTGYFDEILVLETRGWRRLSSIHRMMKQNYKTVVNADLSRTVLADNFVLATGAGERIAPQTDLTRMYKWQAWRSSLLYDKIFACDGIQTMELIRNAQFLRALSGNTDFRAGLPQIPVLVRKRSVLPENYFVLCPGGETPEKYWDPKKYAEVLNAVFARNKKIRCAVLGVKRERKELYKIMDSIEEKDRVIDLLGQTDILEYIEMIRSAAWLLSNDTSAVHIAAAVGTQAVVVAQSWDKGRFFPYQIERRQEFRCMPSCVFAEVPCAGCWEHVKRIRRLKCLRGDRVRCVDQIKVGQVVAMVEKILADDKDFELQVGENEADDNQAAGIL